MKSLICVIALCLTSAQVNNEVCRLVCRNDGYDTGSYLAKQKSCVCGVIKTYETLNEKGLKLPNKSELKKEETLWYEN